MLSRVAVSLLFLAELGFSKTSGSSEHMPEVPAGVVTQLEMHGDGIHGKYPHYPGGMRIYRAWDTMRHLDAIVTSSIMLATLFLLLQCAAYIHGASRLSEGSERRLAEGNPCRGGVSSAC